MGADMGRGGGYDYQWILSFYLYTLLKKEDYILNKYKKYSGKDFVYFVNKINKFREKCVNKYGGDFNVKFEVLVEGEELCLDDITFLSDVDGKGYDNNIFIQVKTKGGEKDNTISTSDGIYKAISNFISNINFQKDKYNGNIMFFIFTNKDLTRPLLERIKSKSTKLYFDFINHIISTNKNSIYPTTSLKNLNIKENTKIITGILSGNDILIKENLDLYGKEYLLKLTTLVNDLRVIFTNLYIITKIDHELLKYELKSYYGKLDYFEEKERISELCFMGEEIKEGSKEFERYKKYNYTYFLPEDGGKFIHQIDSISKGKFI